MFSDAHCDTISRILDKNQQLWSNDGHLDLKRLKENKCTLQFFAAWIEPQYEKYGSLARCIDIIDKFYIEYEINKKHLHLIKNSSDIDVAIENNKIGALLSIEGGSAIEGKLSSLRILYKLGIRAMTLTWNGRNEIADGIGEGDRAGGLSKFGIDVVDEMNRLGMIVDVSHLSERGFWDVAKCSDKPFIASHSNSKSLCNHPRNLSNEQITEIIKRNGFIGINLYSLFLNENGAKISDVIRHIDFFMSLGAEDILGLGADFDGVDDLPQGIGGVEDMQKIIEELIKIGYNDNIINKVLYSNLHRAVKQIMKN